MAEIGGDDERLCRRKEDTDMIEVSIVIVCMDKMEVLRPCLDSIRKHTGVSYETIVVAYMFSEENMEALKTEYPWVKIIVSDELRGFSENNNLALRQVSGEFTFILNDDTFFDSPVIDSLVADFRKLPANAAIVSPKILYSDGSVQTCGRPKFTFLSFFTHYLHLYSDLRKTKWSMQEGLFRTYNINGAAFLARTDPFRKAGWFDERYFFTPEDIALSTLLNRQGYGVYVDSDVKLFHISYSTASRLEPAVKPARVLGAMVFYAEDNPFKRLAIGVFVWMFEALRGLKYLFKDCSEPQSHNAVMAATARNVRRAVFSGKTPGEAFVHLFKTINDEC